MNVGPIDADAVGGVAPDVSVVDGSTPVVVEMLVPLLSPHAASTRPTTSSDAAAAFQIAFI